MGAGITGDTTSEVEIGEEIEGGIAKESEEEIETSEESVIEIDPEIEENTSGNESEDIEKIQEEIAIGIDLGIEENRTPTSDDETKKRKKRRSKISYLLPCLPSCFCISYRFWVPKMRTISAAFSTSIGELLCVPPGRE